MTSQRLPLDPHRRRGFTLVELAIVVLVIGILAAVSVPRYAAAVDRCRVDGAARMIQQDLRFAQATARSTSQPVTVVFSTAANQYELLGQEDRHHPGRPYLVQLAACETPAVLASVDVDGGSTLTFGIDGRPCAGSGTGTPLSSATVTVTSGGETRMISIEKTTGTVSIQ